MVWFLMTPIVIGILVAILLPLFLAHSKIDSCLDTGGSFDYESCKCDYSANHSHKEENQCK